MNPLRLRIEPHDGVWHERALDGDEFVLGRSRTADVPFEDALVSRRHARVYRHEGQWWIEDLGARNRTQLNGQDLTAPAPLNVGDIVRVGQTVARVLGPPDTAPAQAIPAASSSDLAAVTDVTPAAGLGMTEPMFMKTAVVNHSGSGVLLTQTDRLQLLNDIHRALATPISLDALLDLILERCFAVLRPEQGVILLSGPGGHMRVAATRRLPSELEDLPVSRRIVEEVAGKGQSALVLDAARDERFGSSSIISAGVRSVVAAPLVDAGGTLGMIALYSRVKVRCFSQDDLDLLVSLASAAALRVRNVALAEEAMGRRVLEHELALAHDIQMAMQPHSMPARTEIDVAARVEPARSVGGDLCDVVLDGERLWFAVADVSGKGVGAALYMAVARTLFRAIVPGATAVAGVAARMNRELVRDNQRSMFVTAVIGCIELGSGVVTMTDAGHTPPILLSAAGDVSRLAPAKGMALGVLDDQAYAVTTIPLGVGDFLLLYTDGVTEARSAAGEQFELHRLEHVLREARGASASVIIERVTRAVADFVAGAPPEDDVTMLALGFKGSAGG